MQNLAGAAWMKDLDGRYVYANAVAATIFRTPLAQLRGKTDDEVFPSETAAQFKENDRIALTSGKSFQTIETLAQADGIVHYSVVTKFPIFDADGNPAMVGGIAIDITEQRRAEEALRRALEFHDAVMINMGEGLYTVDDQARDVHEWGGGTPLRLEL
jgi:PAS domain S-box-containing protein